MASTPTPTVKALLIDISGTLLLGRTPTLGAVHALTRLRDARIPFRCCSNTSKESSESVWRTMCEAGMDVRRGEVWTSVGAVGEVMKGLGVRRPYMLLSQSAMEECMPASSSSSSRHTEPGFSRTNADHPTATHTKYAEDTELDAHASEARSESPATTYTHTHRASPSPSHSPRKNRIDIENIIENEDENEEKGQEEEKGEEEYDSVIIGLAPDRLTYANLNTAFRILVGEDRVPSLASQRATSNTKRKPKPLIALHKSLYLQSPDGFLSLGPGPFVTALETATGVNAHVVGKPTRLFFESVMRDFERGGERTWRERQGVVAVIGDDVRADLGEGAVELGLWRVLVKTGKYREGDETRAADNEGRPPDQVCASFADFVDRLVGSQGGT